MHADGAEGAASVADTNGGRRAGEVWLKAKTVQRQRRCLALDQGRTHRATSRCSNGSPTMVATHCGKTRSSWRYTVEAGQKRTNPGPSGPGFVYMYS